MGRYVDEVLQPGEVIRIVTTTTWTGYLPGGALWVIALLFFFWHPQSDGMRNIGLVLALVLFLVGTYFMVQTWWKRWTTEVAVTDRRIISKTGFIHRRTVEMHMDKVESVDVIQSILGRLFNYGDIIIRGTGETVEPLRGIDQPLQFRNHVTGSS
jgi:uncharacterized membrane protein YdbT with pleckstrin-like domain